MTHRKYCVLEDDPCQRLALKAILDDGETDFFGDSNELLESDNTYDIAILDLLIESGKNGLEVAKALKQRHTETKIIFYTSLAGGYHLDSALRLGRVVQKTGDITKLKKYLLN